jgi:hypothetical protein
VPFVAAVSVYVAKPAPNVPLVNGVQFTIGIKAGKIPGLNRRNGKSFPQRHCGNWIKAGADFLTEHRSGKDFARVYINVLKD